MNDGAVIDVLVPRPLTRSQGEARVSVRLRDGGSVLSQVRQAGSFKMLFPRGEGPALEAVLLNTSGGMTGGDRFRALANVDAGAALTLSTQAAERAYRARPKERATLSVGLTLAPGARIDWLPQETILYDGAALDRRLRIDLAPGATALVVEPLIIGRTAMGEVVRDAHLTDRWEVWQDGALIFADALRLTGDPSALMDRAGAGGGARAMAALLYLGRDAGARRAALADALGATGGASLVQDGVLFGRVLASDGFFLRKRLIPAIATLRDGPLPKVWRL